MQTDTKRFQFQQVYKFLVKTNDTEILHKNFIILMLHSILFIQTLYTLCSTEIENLIFVKCFYFSLMNFKFSHTVLAYSIKIWFKFIPRS